MPHPKFVNFNDGEGLTHGDLNDLQDRLAYLSLDATHYPRLVDQMGAGSTWDTSYGTPTTWLDNAAFFVGAGGARPYASGLSIGLKAGTLAVYKSTSGLIYTDNNISVFNVSSGTIATLDSNSGGGSTRYDAVVVSAVTETKDNSTSRDFEDATTRAKTTQSQNKDRYDAPTYSVVKGTPGAGRPSLTSGKHLICYCRVTTADVVTIEDCLYPFFGKLEQINLTPFLSPNDYYKSFDKTATDFALLTNVANGEANFAFPCGAPFRLLHLEMRYTVTTLTGMDSGLRAYTTGTGADAADPDHIDFHSDLSGTDTTFWWSFDPLYTGSPGATKAPAWACESRWDPYRRDPFSSGYENAIVGVYWKFPTSGDWLKRLFATVVKY